MNRYQRQIILPQVGEEGQRALRQSKVLLIGAGGLGLPCAQALVAAGVGQLTIVDDDQVSLSNLQRQTLFWERDLGRAKVEVAKERLTQQNSETSIEGITKKLRPQNARQMISGHDLVIDGSDNFATKFLINDACLLEKKPWVYGSVSRFEGQLATFAGEQGCCYRCLYEKMPVSKIENCAEQGVLGAVTGIIGNYQALEALKILIHLRGRPGPALAPQNGRLRIFDLLTLEQQTLLIPKRVNCKCVSGPILDLQEETEICVFNLEKTWQDFDQDMRRKLLFDVRTLAEFEKSHHESGRLWSDERLAELKGLEPKQEATIYLYCSSGKRAQAKCLELRKKGISAFYLVASSFW